MQLIQTSSLIEVREEKQNGYKAAMEKDLKWREAIIFNYKIKD